MVLRLLSLFIVVVVLRVADYFGVEVEIVECSSSVERIKVVTARKWFSKEEIVKRTRRREKEVIGIVGVIIEGVVG